MSTTRLTFLYPPLFRAARLAESARQPAKNRYRSRPCPPNHPLASSFSTSIRARQAAFERHGTAVEPPPVLPDAVKLPQPDKSPSPSPDPSLSQSKKPSTEGSKEAGALHETDIPPSDATKEPVKESAKETTTEAAKEASPGATDPAPATPHQEAVDKTMQHSGPMEAVLLMPPPDGAHHPHISKPTYVHHFDSYTLVKQLQVGGYTQDQAITAMKAIRAILAQNLDVAQEGLVGKSDVDNVGSIQCVTRDPAMS